MHIVNTSIHRILHTYGFQEISLFSLSSILMIIPGIPLVNAVRNLFCGNEMNGILQLMSVLLASLSLALGIRKSQSGLGSMKSRLAEPMNKTVRSEK